MAKKMSLVLKILVLVCLTALVWSAVAGAKTEQIDGKGYINKQDIDEATTPGDAIQVDRPAVNWSGWVNNTSGSPIAFSRAVVEFAGFLPGREFEIDETLEAGGRKSGAGSLDLPQAVLSLKGFYNIKVSGYDRQGDLVAGRSFWIKLGEGNPLTGVVGGFGLAVLALALGLGVSSAIAASHAGATAAAESGQPAKKIGRGRRRLATALALISAPFLFVALGLVSPLQTVPFVGGTVIAGGGVNGLVRLLAKLLSR